MTKALQSDWSLRHLGWITVLIVHVLTICALIWAGNGVPYVSDNNETFSALNHARNLWAFGWEMSAGLTDEAVSPEALAHPVIHSHQGNFPRLFAFVLYALGARSAESQILITSLTIGTASVWMGYAFFRRIAGELFAVIAMLLLVTDFLLFVQWQVNTYRVWHGFFFFAAFATVHGYKEWPPRIWIPATVATYAALFYGELVFAFFAAVAAGLYAIWVNRKHWNAVIAIGLCQGLGAALGLAILVLQLIAYLGWTDFVTDLQLTVLARNFAPDDANFIDRLREFYDQRNIAFFYNIGSATDYLSLVPFLRSIFAFVLQVPGPWLSTMMFVLSTAVILSDSKLPGPAEVRYLSNPGDRIASLFALALGASFVAVVLVPGVGTAAMGVEWPGLPGEALTALLIVAPCVGLGFAIAHGLSKLATALSPSGAPPRLRRSLLAGAFLFFSGQLLLVQGGLYDAHLSEFWLPRVSQPLVLIFTISALGLGALIILIGRQTMLGRWHAVPSQLTPFLTCCVLAYIATYCLSAGYLHSGYLVRLCPFPVFAVQPFLALSWLALFACVVSMGQRMRGRISIDARLAVLATAAATLTMFALSWVRVQATYVHLSAPDQISFIRLLGSEHPEGVVSNTYVIPFAYAADTWGYGFLTGLPASHDPQSVPYMWLADKQRNASYFQPEMYVCFVADNTLADLLRRKSVGACTLDSIVRETRKTTTSNTSSIVAEATDGRWAVVRLARPPRP